MLVLIFSCFKMLIFSSDSMLNIFSNVFIILIRCDFMAAKNGNVQMKSSFYSFVQNVDKIV